jgi:hypothetical protein
MGKEKTTTTTTASQQAEMSPEERRNYELQNQQLEATMPMQTEVQKTGLNLINRLLSGETNLPGFFGEIGNGINEQQIQDMSRASIRDLMPSFNQQGLLDSGTAISAASRTAGDIRRTVGEFNIGNKLNLLNLALSGQAQVQAPISQNAQLMASRLSGLRNINTSQTSTTQGMNPFLKSFQTSLGSSLGSGTFGK